MKLAAKLMFVCLAVVMLMTAVGSYFSVHRGFERFEQRQQQMARETAEAMDERLAEAWQQGGVESLSNAIETLPPAGLQDRVRWVWFERTQVTNGGLRTTVVEQIDINGGRKPCPRTTTDQDGSRHLRTYYPVDLGDGPRGGLEVTGSLEPLDSPKPARQSRPR